MKKAFLTVAIVLGLSSMTYAEEPSIAGDWQLVQQRLSYTGEGSNRFWDQGESETISVRFNTDSTFMTGPDSGRWLFSDGFLLAVFPTEITVLAPTVTGDTVVFANSDFEPGPGDAFRRETSFSVGVKAPASPFVSSEVVGDWVLLSQTVEYVDSPGMLPSRLREISQQRIDLELASSGNLSAEIISSTEDPGEVGTIITGTWGMSGGVLTVVAGGETLERPHLSSGGDLIVHTEEATEANGGEMAFENELELWIKKPASLVASDMLGRWAVAGTTTDLEVTGTADPVIEEARFEESELIFLPGGTGTVRVLDDEEPGEIGAVEPFSWSIDGNELLLSTGGGDFRVVVSEEKDSAVLMKYEEGPSGDTQSFDLFALVKLPCAPGFAGESIGGPVVSDDDTIVTLSIQSVADIPYVVEQSTDMTNWVDANQATLGTGGLISATFAKPAGERFFFRWKVLPLGSGG